MCYVDRITYLYITYYICIYLIYYIYNGHLGNDCLGPAGAPPDPPSATAHLQHIHWPFDAESLRSCDEKNEALDAEQCRTARSQPTQANQNMLGRAGKTQRANQSENRAHVKRHILVVWCSRSLLGRRLAMLAGMLSNYLHENICWRYFDYAKNAISWWFFDDFSKDSQNDFFTIFSWFLLFCQKPLCNAPCKS